MNEELKEEKIKNKISVHEFYFETPLYTSIKLEDLEENVFKGNVDGYNPTQKYETTFKISDERLSPYRSQFYFNFHIVSLNCKRDEDTIITFIIFEADKSIIKIGQTPSLADIQFADLGKKYDKLLNNKQLAEFKKSIGLATHGAGAGSLIYLRRLFEDLVIQAYRENKPSISTMEDTFYKSRMNEKVELLRDFLPSQLWEMKKVYSIISDGIHNLSEEDCLEYFSPLKLSIELILDQKIEIMEKRKKDESVKKQLQKLANKHK